MTESGAASLGISPAFAAAGAAVRLGCLAAAVAVREGDPATAAELDRRTAELGAALAGAALGELPGIAETRQAFRALGKDPSRYRPSSEALLRRVAQGKGLMSVNNLVDINNLVSLDSRLPAGCYDLERVEGALELRVGREGESYEAIARGPFNLASLPVLCDARGPFGSPTSDSVRTMVTPACRRVLLVLYAFGAVEGLEAALAAAEEGLRRYCDGAAIERWEVGA